MNDENLYTGVVNCNLNLTAVSSSVNSSSSFFSYVTPTNILGKYLSGKIPSITPFIEDIISTSELVDEHPLSCLLSYYGANENEEDHSPFYLLFDILVGEGEVSQKEALALLNKILQLTKKWSCGNVEGVAMT